MKDIIENVKFDFTPEFKIEESKNPAGGSKWLSIGGTALVEGMSKNKRVYSFKNLEENDGRQFKWVVGHPEKPEEHIVGSGKLNLNETNLDHSGSIRNTARHPDIVEQVKDGFLGPSIHASADKVTRKEGKYYVEGLNIDGVSLVAFQGVKSATIDYAIAESFDKVESLEDDANNKDKEGIKMDEPKIDDKPKAPESKPDEKPVVEKSTEESVSMKEFKAVKEELDRLKESKKKEIVDKIVGLNKEKKSEDLMKESEDKLDLILEYESKMIKPEGSAIVENDEPKEEKEQTVIEKDGSLRMSDDAYKAYNDEIKNRI